MKYIIIIIVFIFIQGCTPKPIPEVSYSQEYVDGQKMEINIIEERLRNRNAEELSQEIDVKPQHHEGTGKDPVSRFPIFHVSS